MANDWLPYALGAAGIPLGGIAAASRNRSEGASQTETMAGIAGALGLWTIAAPLAGSAAQENAANKAAEREEQAGAAALGDVTAGGQQAMGFATAGRDNALAQYQRQLADAQGYQQGLSGYYAGERGAGQAALQQLNALAAGDASGLAIDPNYQFQKQQGEQAIERAAAAGGSYGGTAHFRNLTRFGQGLASSAYGQASGRLMGLAAQGQAAEGAYQNLNQGATQNILGLYGAQADMLGNSGQYLGNLAQNIGAAQANAINRQSSNANAYRLQAQNAQSYGLGAAGAGLQNAGNTASSILMQNPRSSVAPSNTRIQLVE